MSITKPMSRTLAVPSKIYMTIRQIALWKAASKLTFQYIQLYFCTDLNSAEKLRKSKWIWNFLLVSHNIRGQTGRQQVCGRDPIETNLQSAICLLLVLGEGRLMQNLTKLRNSGTFPAYCLFATCVDLSLP